MNRVQAYTELCKLIAMCGLIVALIGGVGIMHDAQTMITASTAAITNANSAVQEFRDLQRSVKLNTLPALNSTLVSYNAVGENLRATTGILPDIAVDLKKMTGVGSKLRWVGGITSILSKFKPW